MNRTAWTAALIALALTACRKAPQVSPASADGGKSAAADGFIDYDSPKGGFACRAPGQWKLDEDGASVAFLGPGQASISIIRYPSEMDKRTDARKYADSFWEIGPRPVLETREIGGRDAIVFHQERTVRVPHRPKDDYTARHDYAPFVHPVGRRRPEDDETPCRSS